MVGERGRELVQLPQGSNVITNQNTESIISAAARQSVSSDISAIGSQSPDMVAAFKEALETTEIPIKGKIRGRDIEFVYDEVKDIGNKYTSQIG